MIGLSGILEAMEGFRKLQDGFMCFLKGLSLGGIRSEQLQRFFDAADRRAVHAPSHFRSGEDEGLAPESGALGQWETGETSDEDYGALRHLSQASDEQVFPWP